VQGLTSPSMSGERRDLLRRRAETVVLATVAVAGAVWGVTYLFAGVPWAALWPWGLAIAAVALLTLYRRGSGWAVQLLLVLTLMAPWLLMLQLDGFQASGAVMIWSLMAPVAALLVYGFRIARWWFLAYAVLALVAAFLEPSTLPSDAMDAGWRAAYFFLNLVGATAAAWLVIGRSTTQHAAPVSSEPPARVDLDLRPVAVRPLVDSVIEVVAPLANARGLDLVHLVDPAVPNTVVTDEQSLRQVLVNLLTNGVKFTQVGEVSLTVGRQPTGEDADLLWFEVHDTGIGISEEALSRLFESSTQSGLMISQHLVESLGGTIAVESEVEVGSWFRFTIPAVEATEAGLVTADEGEGLGGRRALVLDHNATSRARLRQLLEGWGLDVVSAPSVAQAAPAIDTGVPFDVALIDAQLPYDTGLQLARQLRASTTVIALTSPARRDDVGADDAHAVLTTPVRLSSLHDVLVELLSGTPRRSRVDSGSAPRESTVAAGSTTA
jgi:CheY-like chemotaxis protein